MAAHSVEAPPRLKLSLIVDTGADTTMLNDQHMRTLVIPERGVRDILTATSDAKPTPCSTYDVEFRIETLGDAPFVIPALEILGRPLFNHSVDGMIGRDVLSRLRLTINGPQMRYLIEY